MKDISIEERARIAEKLFNEPFIQEFFKQMEEKLYTSWTISKTTEAREKIHLYWKTLKTFKEYFRKAIDTGKVKELELEKKKKKYGIF